jgi:hypothetical protein
MIVSATQFSKGNLYIPNAKGATAAVGVSSTGITDFIELCERDLLIGAINVTLYEVLISKFSGGILSATAPDWVDKLVNGDAYEYEDRSYVFKGLRADNGVITNYVFNRYLNENYGQLGMDGMERSSSSSSTPIDPTPKDVETWNNFVSAYQGDYNHDLNNGMYHPAVRRYNYGILMDYLRADSRSGFVDLLTYLDHYEKLNTGTYTDLNGQIYERKNSFGL